MKNLNAAILLFEDLKNNINTNLLIGTNFRKDNKKWFVFIILLMFPMMVKAQLEQYSKFNSDGSVEPIIDYFGSKKINNQFSLTFFGLTREKWGQAFRVVLFANR